MTAIREQVLAAAEGILAAIPGYDFRRNPSLEVAPKDKPLLVMFDGGQSEPDIQVSGTARYRLGFSVEMYTDAEPLGPSLNAAYAAVVKALLADRTLGRLALDLTEGEMRDPEIIRADGHKPFIAAPIAFEVEYWTAEGDPEAPAP